MELRWRRRIRRRRGAVHGGAGLPRGGGRSSAASRRLEPHRLKRWFMPSFDVIAVKLLIICLGIQAITVVSAEHGPRLLGRVLDLRLAPIARDGTSA